MVLYQDGSRIFQGQLPDGLDQRCLDIYHFRQRLHDFSDFTIAGLIAELGKIQPKEVKLADDRVHKAVVDAYLCHAGNVVQQIMLGFQRFKKRHLVDFADDFTATRKMMLLR